MSSTKERLKNFFNYLDRVDVLDERTSPLSTKTNSPKKYDLDKSVVSDMSDESIGFSPSTFSEGSGIQIYPKVKQKILYYRRELAKRDEEIKALKEELNKRLDIENQLTKKFKENEKELIANYQQQIEELRNKNLENIQKSVAEKQRLKRKCKQMGEEVKAIEEKYMKKLMEVEENHQEEIKRIKLSLQQSDKLARANWIREKKEEIKQNTIKELEPEIQRLMRNLKQEKHILKERMESNFKKQIEEISRLHERELENLREKMMREREMELQKERADFRLQLEMIKSQTQKETEFSNRTYNQKLKEEADRNLQLLAEEKQRFAERVTMFEKHEKELIERHKKELKDLEERLEKKYKDELEQLEMKFKVEKECWQTQMIQKNTEELQKKEAEMIEKLKKQLNEQIEALVERTQNEVFEMRKQMQKENEHKLDLLQKRHHIELEKLNEAVNQWKEKYMITMKAKSQLMEVRGQYEESIKSLTSQIQDRDTEMIRLTKLLAEQQSSFQEEIKKLKSQNDTNIEMITKEYKNEIENLKEKLKQLQEKYDLKCKEIEELEISKMKDIDELIRTTTQTINAQKHKIQTLTLRLQEAEQQIKDTEFLLDRPHADE